MNVTAHQEKNKTKTGKKKAGKEKRQATDFNPALVPWGQYYPRLI